MKILYLNPDRGIPVLGDKGASVHVREFVSALAGQGHELALACTTLGAGNPPPPARLIELRSEVDEGDLAAERELHGLPAEALDQPIIRRELAQLRHDRGYANRTIAALGEAGFRPDLIYERYALFHCAGAALAGRLGAPRIVEVNAPLVAEQERYRGLALKSVAQEVERASFGCADAIVAVSQAVADHAASCGVQSERILVLPNGVDTARFRPRAHAGALRRRLGLGEAVVIGFVGSFKPWHGVDFLIEAFAGLALGGKDVRLLCVGDGPELELARRHAEALGLGDRVVFTGRVAHADIPAHLATMDISAAPYSPSDDFYFSPLKVVEALACGIPVVATRIGQLEWLVEHEVSGLLAAPGDRTAFSQALHALTCDARRRRAMGEAARRRAQAEFDWSRVAQRVTSQALALIGARRAA